MVPESVSVPAPAFVKAFAPFARIGALIVSTSAATSVRMTSSAPLAFGVMPVPALSVAALPPLLTMPFNCTVAPVASVNALVPVRLSVVKVAVACAEIAPVVCKCAVLATLATAALVTAPVSVP